MLLVSVDEIQKSENRFAALSSGSMRDNTDAISEESFIKEVSPQATAGNIIGADENLEKRKEMLEMVSPEPVDFALERAIGENDSVYSNFVELIEFTKRKVGRIAIKKGSRNIGFATGNMVSENLLLTNWHVFKTKEDVADSEIQFFYELDITGNPISSVCFQLRSDVFYYSNKELDYCFVAVNPTDVTGQNQLNPLIGYIYLDPGLGKLGNEGEEAMNIIHHPDGDYMQLSIRENLFSKITPTTIWYLTDTAPGSSGALVFNDQWQVVALHHMGVAKKNEKGEYVDKNNRPLPVIDGKVDAARVVWEANEGIRISVVLKDFFVQFPDHPVVNGLKKRPGTIVPDENKRNDNGKTFNQSNTTVMDNQSNNNVTISFPPSLIEKNGNIHIAISQGGSIALSKAGETRITEASSDELFAEEIKKLEETLDLSKCKGYQSKFLGSQFDIPLPQPKKSILKFIAKVNGTDSVVLKYYNYSTIFHSVRMMPIISGVNVEGDLNKRLDESKRKDAWLRDNRIGYDIQLDDGYYKNSGFDRGHMSRREDANWGATAEDAKRNADLTCMYTNACPQVAKINQSSRSGLWGILEKVVLEQGAQAEKGKTARISVFNGPIFKEDDPVYKGIQVPMDFYKIVLWLTDNGQLKATAFKLSQEGIVDDIDFEQLDLDQNTEFREYQCSIKSLEQSTRIDFSEIEKFDTFDAKGGAEEVALTSAVDVASHIRKHSKG
jgi:endonuclease G, mitochondrial